jgi:hypothetical protein
VATFKFFSIKRRSIFVARSVNSFCRYYCIISLPLVVLKINQIPFDI